MKDFAKRKWLQKVKALFRDKQVKLLLDPKKHNLNMIKSSVHSKNLTNNQNQYVSPSVHEIIAQEINFHLT